MAAKIANAANNRVMVEMDTSSSSPSFTSKRRDRFHKVWLAEREGSINPARTIVGLRRGSL